MPIYEYQCGACEATVEFIQKFNEAPKRKCPECGALRLKKLVSAAAFHLKGSGWYVTDFRDKDKKKDAGKGKSEAGESKTETTSESKGESKSESKSDSKSDSKSESKSDSKSDAKGSSKSGKSAAA